MTHLDLILTPVDVYEPKSKPNLVEKGPWGPFSDPNLAPLAPARLPQGPAERVLTLLTPFDPILTLFLPILTHFDAILTHFDPL